MVQIKPTCKAENRDSDVKNRGTDAKKGARRKEGLGWMGGGTDMCTPLMLCMNRQLLGTCCMTQGAQSGALRHLEGWDEVGGGRAIQEGGDICIPITNSC